MQKYIKNNKLKVRVKPNSKKTEVERYDEERDTLIIRLKAPADKGKANQELIKFVSKELKKKAEIKSGHVSRDKILEIK